MFADDSTTISRNKKIPDLFRSINKELDNVHAWCMANKLSINVNKTNFIIFQPVGSKPIENKLRPMISNTPIKKVSSVKFLGYYTQENLSWRLQMVHILKKLRVNFAIVKKIKQYLHEESSLILYHSLIRSHIDCCIGIWCHGNKVMVDKLHRSMNKFVRMMYGINKKDDVSEIMKSHNLFLSFYFFNKFICQAPSHFMRKTN